MGVGDPGDSRPLGLGILPRVRRAATSAVHEHLSGAEATAARVSALEARLAEVEARLARLEARKVSRSKPKAPTAPRRITPVPPPPPDPLEPAPS